MHDPLNMYDTARHEWGFVRRCEMPSPVTIYLNFIDKFRGQLESPRSSLNTKKCSTITLQQERISHSDKITSRLSLPSIAVENLIPLYLFGGVKIHYSH